MPLLQFTLHCLWEKRNRNRITWEIYKEVCDYQGEDKPYGPLQALSKSADDFYDHFPEEDQAEIQRILLEMVSVNELLEAYRQPVLEKQLLAPGKANTSRVLAILEKADYIQITPGATPNNRVIQIKHESLIRNWKRLVDWITEKRDSYKQRLAITQACNNWKANNKPTAALLSAWQLQYAKHLSGFSNDELEYLSASEGAITNEQASREKKQKHKIFLLKGLVLASIIISGCYLAWDHFYWQEHKKTWDVLDELKQTDMRPYIENKLDDVAIYLWNKGKNDHKAVKTLLQVLSEADRLGFFMPENYPVKEWQAIENAIRSISKQQEPSIVSFYDPKDIPGSIVSLDVPKDILSRTGFLQKTWKEFAEILWDNGIPMPARLDVHQNEKDDTNVQLKIVQSKLKETTPENESIQSRASSNLKSAPSPDDNLFTFSSEPLPLEKFEYYPEKILISEAEFEGKPEIKKIFDDYSGLIKPKQALTELNLPSWRWIPRWTVPLLKAAGINNYYPPEVSYVVNGVVTLKRDQKQIYSDGFVARLIFLQSLNTPDTVEAACRATGDAKRLINATKKLLVKDSLPLSDIQIGFDDLASTESQYAPNAQQNCLDKLVMDAKTSESYIFKYEVNEAIKAAYKPKPIRVLLSQNLVPAIAPTGTLEEDVINRIDKLRSRLMTEYGFKIPGIKFEPEDKLEPFIFDIEIFSKALKDKYRTFPGQEVEDIFKKLEERFIHTRPLWINFEETARLKAELPPDMVKWLDSKKYDLVKLKKLLRETLAKGWHDRSSIETEVNEAPVEGASLAHFPWLMRSLVFWVNACDQNDYACLGEGLRRTQQARLMLKSHNENTQKIPTEIPGMEALITKHPDKANDAFKRWLAKTTRKDAEEQFIQAYNKLVQRLEYLATKEACEPVTGELYIQERKVNSPQMAEKINAFMTDYQEVLPSGLKRRMTLCQISSGIALGADPNRWNKAIETELNENRDWTPEERYWLAYLGLKAHLKSDAAKYKAPPVQLDRIRNLFLASLSGFKAQQADSGFEEFLGLCTDPNDNLGKWCLDMLNAAPDIKKESYWIPYALAYELSQRSRKDASVTLTLLDQAEQNLSNVEKSRRKSQQAYLTFTRGLAHQTLGTFDHTESYVTAIEYFKESKELGSIPNSEFDPAIAYISLADTYLRMGDRDNAEQALKQGGKLTKEPAILDTLKSREIQILWSKGDFDNTVAMLKGKSDEGSQYKRNLGRMLSKGTIDLNKLNDDINQYFGTSHAYRDYLRLIKFWTLMRIEKPDDAKTLLEKRWAEIAPKSWEARLQQDRGDYMGVWREKLIGRYLGQVSEQDIAELLEGFEIQGDFKSSPFANAEQSRKGFLCEWFFYDALRQWSIDFDNQKLKTNLDKVISTGQIGFHEYSMAKYLIKRINDGENFKISADDIEKN